MCSDVKMVNLRCNLLLSFQNYNFIIVNPRLHLQYRVRLSTHEEHTTVTKKRTADERERVSCAVRSVQDD